MTVRRYLLHVSSFRKRSGTALLSAEPAVSLIPAYVKQDVGASNLCNPAIPNQEMQYIFPRLMKRRRRKVSTA